MRRHCASASAPAARVFYQNLFHYARAACAAVQSKAREFSVTLRKAQAQIQRAAMLNIDSQERRLYYGPNDRDRAARLLSGGKHQTPGRTIPDGATLPTAFVAICRLIIFRRPATLFISETLMPI